VNLLPRAGMHWKSKLEPVCCRRVRRFVGALLCSLGRASRIGAVMGLACPRACLFCCAAQVLHGALQSEVNSSPPLLLGSQGRVGRAEPSQGVPSCCETGLKVCFLATWVDQQSSDLDGALLPPRSEAGSVFCSPFPLSPPLLKRELACFPPASLHS